MIPVMRSLPRHEYRALQRARAVKLALYVGVFALAGVSIGALAAQSLVLPVAVFFSGALIGFALHSLTRPML
jgi:hypothetical protein